MKDSDLIFGFMVSLGKSEYSIADLKWLARPFNITENCIRTALSRMASKGTLESRKEGRNSFYLISSKGKRIGTNVSLSFRKPDWETWDRSWTGVLFSVPGTEKSERYHIRRKLTAYRFTALYPGVWIRPYNKNEDHEVNLLDIINSKHCNVVKYKYLNNFGKDDVIRLWKLLEVNKALASGLKLLNKKSKSMDSLSPEKAFVDHMLTGGKIVNALFMDPLLPDEYLPENWHGRELRDKFSEWINAVYEISKPYWGKIFE